MSEWISERIHENQERICELELRLRARTDELVEILNRDLDAEAAALLDTEQGKEK